MEQVASASAGDTDGPAGAAAATLSSVGCETEAPYALSQAAESDHAATPATKARHTTPKGSRKDQAPLAATNQSCNSASLTHWFGPVSDVHAQAATAAGPTDPSPSRVLLKRTADVGGRAIPSSFDAQRRYP